MTRENKLALLIGFSVILIVGMLVGDYFSKARSARVDPGFAAKGQGTQTPVTIEPAPAPELMPDPVAPPGGTIVPAGQRREFPIEEQIASGFRPVDILNGGNGAIPNVRADDVELPPETVIDVPGETVEPAGRAALLREYTVKPGDALEKIAREQLGDPKLWRTLADINHDLLKGSHDLRVGMKLRLPEARTPVPATRTVTERAAATAKPAAGSTKALRSYTVRSGDTLKKIARQLLGDGDRSDEIARLNKITDANRLLVGTTLKIPAR
ncbi:MAG: LysM peptidoglycan-binding domain-containing protein [Phycisphaerales bacterium]